VKHERIPQKRKIKTKNPKKYSEYLYEKRFYDGQLKSVDKKQRKLKHILEQDF
jgi:hypothetical protein